MSLKVCILPEFPNENATGGVARVVQAQMRYLPQYDIELVKDYSQANIVICHAGEPFPRVDVPKVAYNHGIYWSEYKWPKWAPLRNAEIARALVEADVIMSPSEWVADIIRHDLWCDVQVFPNGIDPELLGGPQLNDAYGPVWFNKARVDAICEIGSLTELARRSPDVPFLTVPPVLRPLPNVRSSGVVPYDQALDAMRHAAIYLATTREVFGISVLEALACGVPILGYAFGGQREQLLPPLSIEGVRPEGILVAPYDMDALKAALDGMRHPPTWKAMSEATRERARVFLWPDILERQALFLHDLWQRWPVHRPASSPEISIVIPLYNMKQWLAGCLASVLRQTGAPPFEIIIVDDASTDGSYEEAQKLSAAAVDAGFDVRVLKHASNRYLAEALNTGIREARGKWIVNLDPDNELPKDALRNLERAAARHPELDCVYGLMEIIKSDGSLDTRWANGIATYPPRTYSYEAQLAHSNQVHSSAMFRRRMWERAGGYRQYAFDDGTRLNSDAEFWTRCGALGFRFGRVLNEPTLRYRLRPDSMSRTVPEWDWTEPSPRHPVVTLGAPGGRVRTHEPIAVTVIVESDDPAGAVESLWPQTFDRWECFVRFDVLRTLDLRLPPYALVREEGIEDTLKQARGKWVLRLRSQLAPDALASLVEKPPGVYDESDLEGKVVLTMAGCGSCGGGMRFARRPGPPASARAAQAPTRPEKPATRMQAQPQPRKLAMAQPGISGQMTFLEFLGSGFRTRYMHRVNPVTRQRFQYVFGSEQDHKRVLVYVEDVPEIVQNIQYREVPLDELTDVQREQLAAINEAAAEAAREAASFRPPTITITAATGRVRTYRGDSDPGDVLAAASDPTADPTGGWSAV